MVDKRLEEQSTQRAHVHSAKSTSSKVGKADQASSRAERKRMKRDAEGEDSKRNSPSVSPSVSTSASTSVSTSVTKGREGQGDGSKKRERRERERLKREREQTASERRQREEAHKANVSGNNIGKPDPSSKGIGKPDLSSQGIGKPDPPSQSISKPTLSSKGNGQAATASSVRTTIRVRLVKPGKKTSKKQPPGSLDKDSVCKSSKHTSKRKRTEPPQAPLASTIKIKKDKGKGKRTRDPADGATQAQAATVFGVRTTADPKLPFQCEEADHAETPDQVCTFTLLR